MDRAARRQRRRNVLRDFLNDIRTISDKLFPVAESTADAIAKVRLLFVYILVPLLVFMVICVPTAILAPTRDALIILTVFGVFCGLASVVIVVVTDWLKGTKTGYVPKVFLGYAAIATVILTGVGLTNYREYLDLDNQSDWVYNRTISRDMLHELAEGKMVALTDAVVRWEAVEGSYIWCWILGCFSCIAPIVPTNWTQQDPIMLWASCETVGSVCSSSNLLPQSECFRNWQTPQLPDDSPRMFAHGFQAGGAHYSASRHVTRLHNMTGASGAQYVRWQPIPTKGQLSKDGDRAKQLIIIGALIFPVTFIVVLDLVWLVRHVRPAYAPSVILFSACMVVALLLPFIIWVGFFVSLAPLFIISDSVAGKQQGNQSEKKSDGFGMGIFIVALVMGLAWSDGFADYVVVICLGFLLKDVFHVMRKIDLEAEIDVVVLEKYEEPFCIRPTCKNALALVTLIGEFIQCVSFAFSDGSRLQWVTLNTWQFTTHYALVYWICFGFIVSYMYIWLASRNCGFLACTAFFAHFEPLFSCLLFMPFLRVFLSALICHKNPNTLLLEVPPLSGVYCYVGWHFLYTFVSSLMLVSYLTFVNATPGGSYLAVLGRTLDIRWRPSYLVLTNFTKLILLIAQVFSLNNKTASRPVTICALFFLSFVTLYMRPSPSPLLNWFRTNGYVLAAWIVTVSTIFGEINALALVTGWLGLLLVGLLLLWQRRQWFCIEPQFVKREQVEREEEPVNAGIALLRNQPLSDEQVLAAPP